jgi:hypothetical protein
VSERLSGAVSERLSGAVSERLTGAVSERLSGVLSGTAQKSRRSPQIVIVLTGLSVLTSLDCGSVAA